MTLFNSRLLGLASLAMLGASMAPDVVPTMRDLQVRASPDRVVSGAVGMPAKRVRTDAQPQALWSRMRRTPSGRYPRPGYSVRQGQRMAAKRRNQVRARRAARG